MTRNKPNKSFAAIFALGLVLSITCSVAPSSRVSPAANVTPATSQDPDVHTIKDAGLQFELPKGWKLKTQENGQIVVYFDEGAASVTFIIEDKYNDVIASLKTGLKEKLTPMKSDGEAKEDTHNGMSHISESGSGQMKGMKIMWSIDVLKAGKAVTLFTFGAESSLQAHIDEYLKLVGSLKKI